MVSALSALVVVVVVAVVSGEADFCASKVKQYMDIHKLRGEWLEQETFNGDGIVEEHSCHVSFLYPSKDGSTISVSNNYLNSAKQHKEYSYIVSDKDVRPDGNLVAKMKISKFNAGETEVEWDVLGTDYTTYLVVQVCLDNPGTDKDYKAVILYVKEKPIEAKFEDALNANKLDREAFTPTMPGLCPAVVFPPTFKAAAA